MKPAKLTVYDIFEQTKRYIVPLYQRSYVWTREDQWVPLWDDIEAKAASMWDGQHHPPPHFLGAVVLNQIQSFGREVFKTQIIDGQQRLTTLQVFLAALRDHVDVIVKAEPDGAGKDELQKLYGELAKLTRNQGRMAGPDEEYKVWPTNFDRDCFKQVMSACSLSELTKRFPIKRLPRHREPEPRPLLVEAYQYFYEAIAGFLTARSTTPDSYGRHPLEVISDALKTCLQVVVIDLESDDDPQVIFETLNARGVPLLPTDLIRNHLFGRAAAQRVDTDLLYHQYWAQYDERRLDGGDGFWKKEGKQGRLFRPRFDLFFQHYLACRAEKDISPGHLFQHFRAWWEDTKPEPSVLTELGTLKHFAEVFRSFYEPQNLSQADPCLAAVLRRLKALDTNTFYPLLLFLLVEGKDRVPIAERDKMLGDLESFLVRGWICGLSTKSYNKLFMSLVKDLRRATTPSASVLRKALLDVKGDNAWPNDIKFERAWLSEPVYKRLKSDGVQMVLKTIHDQMLTTKQEKVTISSPLSIEHVMPQDWRTHWPPPVPAPSMSLDDLTPEQKRDEQIHTFGNLTLLTSELNSSVGNGAYILKRDAILLKSLLRLNTYFQKVEHWDEMAIEERGKYLFSFARALWPFPAPIT